MRQRTLSESDDDRLKSIRRIAVIALFSDNLLMSRLVLKGGNAIDLIYQLGGRASVDVDFSMSDDFEVAEFAQIKGRIDTALEKTFLDYGFRVFDVSIVHRPPHVSDEMKDFWGGYRVEFKVIEKEKYDVLVKTHELLQKSAIVVGEAQRRKFEIDISKHEYTGKPVRVLLDGYTVFAYSLDMIVAEKLRAICQQHDSYLKLVKSKYGGPRARDFFDIYLISEHHSIVYDSDQFRELIQSVFASKRVPLTLLGEVRHEKEKHRADFSLVKDTVPQGTVLREYDFYFDYVVKATDALESLWNI